MIKVDTYKYIKDLHVKERRSIRQISNEVGLSRQTIRKILYGAVDEVTRYKRKLPPPAPLRTEFEPIIRQWLLGDMQSPPKQRHNAQRIFERLQDEYDFAGGCSTVRYWVRDIKRELNVERIDSFLPLEHDPVGHAQCDWTPVVSNINGRAISGDLFLFRFSYSKAFFVRFYPHQRQESLFDAHEQAFLYFGGVPSQILYDNMKTAVKRVLVGRRREEQDSFLKFRAHHGFDSQFCNVARGNEKGLVEGLARYVKNHVFTPVPEFESIEVLNDWLLERCRQLNAKPRGRQRISFADRFCEEQPALLPCSKHTFDCCTRKEAKVNRSSLVSFDKNQYSVPVEWTGRMVTVKGYVHEVKIFDKQTLLAIFARSYESGQQYFQLEHYLKLLERKPRAVGQAKPVRRANLPAVFARYHQEAMRRDPDGADAHYVGVLLLLRHHSAGILAEALEKALNEGVLAVNAIEDHANTFARYRREDVPAKSSNTPASIPTLLIAPTEISRYRQLTQGGLGA